VRPKWALTPQQAAALLDNLPPLARALVRLAILSGLRHGEVFALRWRDIDEQAGADGPGKRSTTARWGRRKPRPDSVIPSSEAALWFLAAWKRRAAKPAPDALVFGTRTGKSISPTTCCGGRSSRPARRWGCRTRRD
jgi:integrase